jgi:hypothetical protein
VLLRVPKFRVEDLFAVPKGYPLACEVRSKDNKADEKSGSRGQDCGQPFTLPGSEGWSAVPSPGAAPSDDGRLLGRAVRHLREARLPVCSRTEAQAPLLPLLEGAGAEPLVVRAPGESERIASPDSKPPTFPNRAGEPAAASAAGLAAETQGGAPSMMGQRPRRKSILVLALGGPDSRDRYVDAWLRAGEAKELLQCYGAPPHSSRPDFEREIPHRSTFIQNRPGRFRQPGVFSKMFEEIVRHVFEGGLVERRIWQGMERW